MEAITPSVFVNSADLLNGTKCDGVELTKNLFKDHNMSLDVTKKQKLETYLRIRSLPNFEPKDRQDCYQLVDSTTLLVIPPKGSNNNKFNPDSDRKKFGFSKIFDEKANQSIVYDSCALPIVKRFLSGQNGLLFAYGITSSGKSYTMRGTTANPGVIPRSLSTLFEVIGNKINKEVPNLKPNTFTDCSTLSPEEKELEEEVRSFIFNQTDESYELRVKMDSFRSQLSVIHENSDESHLWDDLLHSTFRANESNIRCSVWISFYEIYNENIYDLLELEVTGEKKSKILLLKDEYNNYYVKGLRQILVTSPEEAYKVLLFGQNNLHISSTNLNKNSSRSHCAFTITLVSTFADLFSKRSPLIMNHLCICDLAGAERSEKANNCGDRIREAGKINGSLLSLSRCISTLRHNQKFEHDASKQRFVNYRDSKLTKVFQPFLSGIGSVAMISTMNPSPNLFDETFFALKFTGVASQVIVSSEDQRNKFHDSLKRLTQIWMQSSERWSNFAALKPPKPSVSIIETIKEEEEESEGDNECLDMTIEQMSKRVDEITHMDLSRADPQEIEVLKTQIDFLVEKLKQSENDKFEMEIEVRKQVVNEFNKLFKDMEEMADNKDRAKRELEDMMTKRLVTTENRHKQERLGLENKINLMETENFKLTEQLCQLRDDRDKALSSAQQIIEQKDQIIEEQNRIIRELEQQIYNSSVTKCLKDSITSPFKVIMTDNSTSPFTQPLINANTSAINLLETNEINTSAIGLMSPMIATTDRGVDSIFTEMKDSETSTTNLVEMIDTNTSHSVESSNKSTLTQIQFFEDKQTETQSWSPPNTTLLDMSTSIRVKSDATTSPLTFTDKSPDLKSKQETNELREKLVKYQTEIKQMEAILKLKNEEEGKYIRKIADITEEKTKLETELKNRDNFEKAFKSFAPKPKTETSSVASSVSSFGETDTSSVVSDHSLPEKTKKTLKYSSRKRNPNINNSSDKRYLNSMADPLETTVVEKCSQNSTESCYADEVGNEVFSHKKKSSRKTKRKTNNCSENEDIYVKAPQSKRKRPALKNLSPSAVSPIPEAFRVTRSKARKHIDFSFN